MRMLGKSFFRFWLIVLIVTEIGKGGSGLDALQADQGKTSPSGVFTLSQFLKSSIRSNPTFQSALVDNLYLRYQKDLNLPAGDVVLSVSSQYGVYLSDDPALNGNGDFGGNASLSKLFPSTGTTVSVSYSKSPDYSQNVARFQSSIGLEISQSIVKNAFGRGVRLQKQKIGLENELAYHQIVEAYEDYLATLAALFASWYEAYEQARMASDRLVQQKKLYEFVRAKRGFRVARRQDADNAYLQVLAAQQETISYKRKMKRLGREVLLTAGLEVPSNERDWPQPAPPGLKLNLSLGEEVDKSSNNKVDPLDFTAVDALVKQSRSAQIIALLEKQGLVAEQIAEDNLLPSTEIFIGLNRIGRGFAASEPEHVIYGGIRSDLNFGRTKEKAARAVARLDGRKQRFESRVSYLNLRVSAANIWNQLQTEKELAELAIERVQVASRVTRQEQADYLKGKGSLNDLVDARQAEATARFEMVRHEVLYQQYIIEWKRLSDSLVKKLPAYR